MDTLYYDGDCGLCEAIRRWLSRLDFARRIRWIAYQSLQEPPPGLAWADLERAAFLRTPDGRLYEGFYAFRMLSIRLPLLMPLAPLAWFPGIDKLGIRVYGWVAANRRRIPLGCRRTPSS